MPYDSTVKRQNNLERSLMSRTQEKTIQGLGERPSAGSRFSRAPEAATQRQGATGWECVCISPYLEKSRNKEINAEPRVGLASGGWLCSCGAWSPWLHHGPRDLLRHHLPRVAKFTESRGVVGNARGEGKWGDVEWMGTGF